MRKILSGKSQTKSVKTNMPRISVHRRIEQNINKLKNIFKDCNDVIYREFEIGTQKPINAVLIFIDGMVDRQLINEQVAKPLMLGTRITSIQSGSIRRDIYQLLKDKSITATDIKETGDLQEAVDAVLSGQSVLILDGYDNVVIIESRGWMVRGITEPETEALVRGSRDGFTETIKINIVAVRRRIKDAKFKVKMKKVGRRSKTDVAMLYIEDIVDKQLIEQVESRLDSISIDGVLESGYIEQFIEDNWLSPFPQVRTTERPDSAAANILEGRVVLLIDNTPFALVMPATFNNFFHSPEDYYERWMIGSFIRILRFAAGAASLTLSSFYVAFTSYHPGIIPSDLALSIAGSREGVPFPAVVEAMLMEFTLELLREAGVRLPGPIGQTIGIVGGIIIGQAAVDAAIVSPIMVIIVAFSALSSFAIPNYSVAIAFRLLRFVFIILAGILGLYGIMLGILGVLIHMSTLKSFGVPYLTPFAQFESNDIKQLKDSFIRVPIPQMQSRPGYTAGDDKTRMHKNNRSGDKTDDKRQ